LALNSILIATVACSGVSGSSGNSAAPTATLSANPTSIGSGGTATLTWATTNANTVTIDNGVGEVPASGQKTITPAKTTTYTLTASGNGGTITANATVTVSTQTAPTVTSFTASPASIAPGQSSTLTWSTSNADTVTIDNGVGSQPASGQVPVTPSATTTYTLVANGSGGQSSPATAVVTVGAPTGMSKVNHIIFMLQENRSFDQYFGKLNDYRATQGLGADVDGIPASGFSQAAWAYTVDPITGAANRAKTGGSINSFHLQTSCVDNTTPTWDSAHAQRSMADGWSFTSTGYAYSRIEWDIKGSRVMGYYDQNDLNYYYFMATQFATSNRWFAPVLTRTQPNLMYAYAATSAGFIYPPTAGDPPITNQTIFDLLEAKGISWKVYFPVPASGTSVESTDEDPESTPVLAAFPVYNKFLHSKIVPVGNPATSNSPATGYFADLQNGTLPSVAFILSDGSDGLDEHTGPDGLNQPAVPGSTDFKQRCAWQPPILDPAKSNDDPTKYDVVNWNNTTINPPPAKNCGINVQAGAQYVSQRINALMNSSSWKDSVFILSFDEWGGVYDHVKPAAAVAPDNIPPRFRTDPTTGAVTSSPGDFTTTGFRVPLIVISPFTKKGYVSNTPMDHTAVLKFIEDRFGLPSLTKRDAAQATPDGHAKMLEFFDFDNPPWMTPPANIPAQNTSLPCDRTMVP
jgi:phospholipase C